MDSRLDRRKTRHWLSIPVPSFNLYCRGFYLVLCSSRLGLEYLFSRYVRALGNRRFTIFDKKVLYRYKGFRTGQTARIVNLRQSYFGMCVLGYWSLSSMGISCINSI